MEHFHLFVGGINSSSLEETTEAKWTSTGHETSQRHTEKGREGGREGGGGGGGPEEEMLPSVSFATRNKQKPPGSETC